MYSNGSIHKPTATYTSEDGDVIGHEFGHAMHYKIGAGLSGSSLACQSLKEDCSDYWASSHKRYMINNGCNNRYAIADGFEHGPLRYNNLDLTYDDYSPNTSQHINGQIGCSVMMKIGEDLGKDVTDNLFLKAHTLGGSSASMQDATYAIIKADEQLYNKAHYCKILQHFYNAKFIDHNYPGFLELLNNGTINISLTLYGCHVYIYDVILWPTGKLTINAETSVTIDAPFEVQDGAELEINILP